jgi:hypothetical protein
LRYIYLLAVCSGLVACGPKLTINERVEQLGDGPHLSEGRGCFPIEGEGESSAGSGSSAGDVDGDFVYRMATARGLMTLEIRSGGNVLAERRYDEAFARSGTVDDFTVRTLAGKEYRLRYWGSLGCDIDRFEQP